MRSSSSALRRWGWRLTWAVAVVCAIAVAAYSYFQTDAGRQTLARAIEQALSGPGTKVSIGAVGPNFPVSLSVFSVDISDGQGPWLHVDYAGLDWRPVSLLSGRLHVTDLEAADIRLDRLPEGSPSEKAPETSPPASLEIPSLPVDVQIDRVRVTDITLAEAVVGEAMELDLSGQVAAEAGATVRTDLRLERTDAGGLITLVGELRPVAQTLSVDLEAREPDGGLIARLLGLTPYPPVTITLKGEGPLNAWSANLDARADGVADLTADLRVTRDRTTTIALEGRADVDGLVDPALAPLVAEGVGFSLSAHLTDLDGFTVDRLSVETKALAASASGRVGLSKNDVDARVTVTVSRGNALEPLLAPLGVGSIAGEAKLSGVLTAPTVDLWASVQDMTAAAHVTVKTLEVSAKARLSESPMVIDANLEGHGLKAEEPTVAALTASEATVAISGTYDAASSALRIERFDAKSGPTRLSGHGEYTSSTQQLAAQVDAQVADLSALGETLGMPFSGHGSFTAETEGNLETLHLQGSVKGDVPRASVGHPEADELLRDGMRLSGTFTLDGEDDVRLDARIEAGKLLELEAEGRIKDTIAAAGRLHAGDLSAFSRLAGVPLSGALSMTAHAEGTVADATGTLSAALSRGAIAGVAIPRASLEINAKDLMQSPAGRLSLDARTGHGPAKLHAAFTLADYERLDLRDLAGDFLGLKIAGNVRAPLDGGVVVGRLRANFEGTGGGRDMAGVRVAGRSELDLRLGERAGKQSADVTVSASSLSVSVDGGDPLVAERISLEAALTDVLGNPRGRVQFQARDVGSAGFKASTVTMNVDGSLADAGFQARMEGSGEPDFHLALTGRAAMERDTYRMTLQRLDGALGDRPVKLERPATMTYASDRIAVENLSLGVGDGTIAVDGRLGGARTAARVRVAALPLDLVGLFVSDISPQGRIDVDADVRAEGKGLGGRAKVSGRGVSWKNNDIAEDSPIDIDLNAVWRNGTVAADGRVRGIGAEDLVLKARLPLAVDARSLRSRVDQRAPIAATIRWHGEIEPLWELLPLTDQRLAGPGRIAVDVTGTLANPRATGEVIIENGTYEHLVFGTLIEDFDLRAEVSQGQVINISLSGTDGGTGRISGEGVAHIDNFAGKPIDMTVRFDQATLVRRDDVTASASGTVTFSGTATQGRIEGRIRTDRVDVRLVDQLPPTVVNLDVIEVHAKDDPRSREDRSKPAQPSQFDLDITIELPRAVYVQGRGLESEWAGSFRVTGDASDPRIEGSLSIIRGQFTFAGRRFRLTKGVVTLDGGQKIDPRIDIVAEFTATGITATVSVTGQASNPNLALSSSPPLPPGEILPRVLFGKSGSQLSPAEAAQLALAVQGLASGGVGIGDDILSRVRNTLGIDVLSVESVGEDGSGTAVRVGRYVSEDIYVETLQGNRPGSTVYRVQVNLFDGVALESVVDQGTENASGSVGLKWEHRY
jgi:translocation and assembly module TamB